MTRIAYPHGTEQARRRHKYNGEDYCDACTPYRRPPGDAVYDAKKAAARARGAAYRRLACDFPGVFLNYLIEARKKEGLE